MVFVLLFVITYSFLGYSLDNANLVGLIRTGFAVSVNVRVHQLSEFYLTDDN